MDNGDVGVCRKGKLSDGLGKPLSLCLHMVLLVSRVQGTFIHSLRPKPRFLLEVSWHPCEEAGVASWGAPSTAANMCLDSSRHMLVHQTNWTLKSKGSFLNSLTEQLAGH